MTQFRPRRVASAAALACLTVATIAAGASSAVAASSTEDLTKVRWAQNNPPNANYMPLIVADEHGYFADEGIEIEFRVAANATDSMKLLVSGEADLGSVNSLNQIIARPRGVELRSFATTAQIAGNGIMAPAELGLEDLEQLEGLTVGMSGFAGNRVVLEDILRNHGVDLDQIDFIDIGPGERAAQALAAGSVDVLGDQILWGIGIAYNATIGAPLDDTTTYDALRFADLGAPPNYIHNLTTSVSFMEENPELIRSFLRAWTAALEWALENPDQAAQLVVDAYPENQLDIATAQWNALIPYITSPDTDEHGLGWQDPAKWQAQADFLYEHGIIDEPVDTSDLVTNDYLPSA